MRTIIVNLESAERYAEVAVSLGSSENVCCRTDGLSFRIYRKAGESYYAMVIS